MINTWNLPLEPRVCKYQFPLQRPCSNTRFLCQCGPGINLFRRLRCVASIAVRHWRQTTTAMATIMASRRLGASLCSRFYSSSAAATSPSAASSAATSASGEIGVQDFIKSIKGVEAQADKVAQAIIGMPTLLQTRSSRLKKLGIPCKQRKMILRYTEKYRQGIWTPRMSIKQ